MKTRRYNPSFGDDREVATNQYNLLIVDDEISNLQKLRRTFFGDFRIFEALTGQDAIQLLRKQDVDVIITDQRMPETTGIDVLRESLLLQPEAVRIILTGYTEIDYLMDAINEDRFIGISPSHGSPFSLKQTVMQDLELVHLKREHRLLQEQVRIARQVQSRLFPQKLQKSPLSTTRESASRLGRSGADYYDVLKVSSTQFCLAVGDISGKGNLGRPAHGLVAGAASQPCFPNHGGSCGCSDRDEPASLFND